MATRSTNYGLTSDDPARAKKKKDISRRRKFIANKEWKIIYLWAKETLNLGTPTPTVTPMSRERVYIIETAFSTIEPSCASSDSPKIDTVQSINTLVAALVVDSWRKLSGTTTMTNSMMTMVKGRVAIGTHEGLWRQ
jgi:hypothetical protein